MFDAISNSFTQTADAKGEAHGKLITSPALKAAVVTLSQIAKSYAGIVTNKLSNLARQPQG